MKPTAQPKKASSHTRNHAIQLAVQLLVLFSLGVLPACQAPEDDAVAGHFNRIPQADPISTEWAAVDTSEESGDGDADLTPDDVRAERPAQTSRWTSGVHFSNSQIHVVGRSLVELAEVDGNLMAAVHRRTGPTWPTQLASAVRCHTATTGRTGNQAVLAVHSCTDIACKIRIYRHATDPLASPATIIEAGTGCDTKLALKDGRLAIAHLHDGAVTTRTYTLAGDPVGEPTRTAVAQDASLISVAVAESGRRAFVWRSAQDQRLVIETGQDEPIVISGNGSFAQTGRLAFAGQRLVLFRMQAGPQNTRYFALHRFAPGNIPLDGPQGLLMSMGVCGCAVADEASACDFAFVDGHRAVALLPAASLGKLTGWRADMQNGTHLSWSVEGVENAPADLGAGATNHAKEALLWWIAQDTNTITVVRTAFQR